MPKAKLCVRFYYALFLYYSSSIFLGGHYSHAADVLNSGSTPVGWPAAQFREEMEQLKFAYKECVGELRQQSLSIQRLQDLAETQGGMIKELEGITSQQQKEIEKLAMITGSNLTKQSPPGYVNPSSNSPSRPPDVATGQQGTPDKTNSFLKSCDEIRSHQQLPGISQINGPRWIDPDGQGGDGPVLVFCDLSTGATIISHDSENLIKVPTCSSPGCFKRPVRYQNVTANQVIALTRISTVCQQQLKYDPCTEDSFTRKRAYVTSGTSSSWWTNRNGAQRFNWPVKMKNDAGVIVNDANLINNLQDLPVIELNIGPEFGSSGLCSSQFQLGKLICYGRSPAATPEISHSRDSQKGAEIPASRGGHLTRNESKSSKRSRHRSSSRNSQTGSGEPAGLSNAGCTFDLLESSPQYPPHLIDENNNIIQPVLQGRSRIITLGIDEQITVGCLGNRHDKPSSNNTLKATGQQLNEAVCTINSTLRVNQAELSYSQLGCTNQNKEILKEDGPCADGRGILVRVGWNVDSHFIPLYDTCHDKIGLVNYYSTHNIIGRSVDADDKTNTRPSFRQAGYYPGLDVNGAFGQPQQNKTISRVVGGSPILLAKYFNQKKNFFLARGHLAPDGDFIDSGSQDATYYYLNMAPQWQSFNGGNWNVLETAVRKIATTRDLDLIVHTGTFGTMTLTDASGHQQPLYLTFDKNNKGVIPVPKYYWKLIHDPVAETATAVLGFNDPHMERILPGDILCPDVCSQIPWIHTLNWKINDISKGYMFCCTAEELHKAIPFAPNLIAPLFL